MTITFSFKSFCVLGYEANTKFFRWYYPLFFIIHSTGLVEYLWMTHFVSRTINDTDEN